jgi:hypothetical protein
MKWWLRQAVEEKKVDAGLQERIQKLLKMNSDESQKASG